MKAVTPQVSAWHLLGAELRRLRVAAGLSQHRLARLVYVSGDLVRKVELAQRAPSAYLVASLDRLLGTGGRLARLRQAALVATPTAAERRAARKALAVRLDRLARLLDSRQRRPRPPRAPTNRAWRLPCPHHASSPATPPGSACPQDTVTFTLLALITIPTPRHRGT